MNTKPGASEQARVSRRPRTSGQPLDKAARIMMAALGGLIAIMLLLGSQSLLQVRSFSWQGKSVSPEDVAFSLTFSRPVVTESVEQNLRIEPELLGKFSWAGRKMAYTLTVPAVYGQTYEVSLPEADALLSPVEFEPFQSTFKTRDRMFAYIGAAGEESGRIVIFNLTDQKKTILTPESQRVMDFKVYPNRDRILYSAVPSENQNNGLLASAQLYTITTGLAQPAEFPAWQFWKSEPEPVAGEVETLLSNEDYQNLKFDLSANGEVIVIQRVGKENPADSGPWILAAGEAPRKLESEPGGDFTIAPDSTSLLLQQGEGTAVIELSPDPDSEKPDELLDFLPDYGLTLDIASDGSAAALVNFNQDDPEKRFTQSLFWVSNRGEEKALLETEGSIMSAQFGDRNQVLYCLVNELIGDEDNYIVMPYLTAINVETGEEERLIEMPPQSDITVALSPDGLAILFDEALSDEPQTLDDGSTSPTHRLWLLPLFSTSEERLAGDPVSLPPTELDIAGRSPTWLP